ncbi:hypothetical protein CC2G_002544 [Coprinopsis cinerea AmutBmut pab1-1]|nr:hypothetical protein CC2G_002544 [Coprinopsis cinerea AmutBmut pab1-1]
MLHEIQSSVSSVYSTPIQYYSDHLSLSHPALASNMLQFGGRNWSLSSGDKYPVEHSSSFFVVRLSLFSLLPLSFLNLFCFVYPTLATPLGQWSLTLPLRSSAVPGPVTWISVTSENGCYPT